MPRSNTTFDDYDLEMQDSQQHHHHHHYIQNKEAEKNKLKWHEQSKKEEKKQQAKEPSSIGDRQAHFFDNKSKYIPLLKKPAGD